MGLWLRFLKAEVGLGRNGLWETALGLVLSGAQLPLASPVLVIPVALGH